MSKQTNFNPIKEDKNGVRAKKVIWSTHTIQKAISGLDNGKKLVANPFYEYNTKLLKSDIVFERTEEEIKEWKKCANDITYFIKYCKLMTPEGIKNIKLRNYQEKYLKHLIDNRLSIYLSCRQSGKCVTLNTYIQCKINNNVLTIPQKKTLSKYKKNDYYELPMFEIVNIYKTGWRWKIKYFLYRMIDKIYVFS